jgi:hypothetical protein
VDATRFDEVDRYFGKFVRRRTLVATLAGGRRWARAGAAAAGLALLVVALPGMAVAEEKRDPVTDATNQQLVCEALGGIPGASTDRTVEGVRSTATYCLGGLADGVYCVNTPDGGPKCGSLHAEGSTDQPFAPSIRIHEVLEDAEYATPLEVVEVIDDGSAAPPPVIAEPLADRAASLPPAVDEAIEDAFAIDQRDPVAGDDEQDPDDNAGKPGKGKPGKGKPGKGKHGKHRKR